MSDVLNRDTMAFRRSVNAPDFPDPPWLHNPDLSSVEGVEPKYWKLTGDVVSEMLQAEKDAVDAAEMQAGKDSDKAQIDEQRILRAFALIVLDEVNALRSVARPTMRVT